MPVLPEPSDFPSAPGQKEKDQKKPTASDFIDKGPQIPGNNNKLPPKASREEIEARMKELNETSN